jgi:type III pantothenate kinase
MLKMLLLVDIGNTNITIGFYDKEIKNILRLNTVLKGRDEDEYFYLLKGFISHYLINLIKKIEAAVICSVVPSVTPLFMEALRKCFGFEPINVSHKLKTGLKFCIKNPDELGADRIANAVAARKLYKGHLIVIDFGTATTFCVISTKGEYRGGVIMPGLGISADVLVEKTAKLPKIELRAPEKMLGNDTKSSILSGVVLGHAGAVERVIKELKTELSCDKSTDAKIATNVIATGGFAELVVPFVKGVKEVNPLLTLEGLRIIYELNV